MAIEVEYSLETGVRFIRTPECIWFEEFAQTCGHYGYIGLCQGSAGVGKTWAARNFSQWETARQHNLLTFEETDKASPLPQLPLVKALFYTAPITNTPRRLQEDLNLHFSIFQRVCRIQGQIPSGSPAGIPPILLVDEADRLNVNSLEFLRDLYDKQQFTLVLIGMPGLEQRLKRYPQLYSRVGFSHSFRPLATTDLKQVLLEKAYDGQLILPHPPFADDEALGAVIRTCRGNMRLLMRLLDQIERVMRINQLGQITTEVVLGASQLLTLGIPD